MNHSTINTSTKILLIGGFALCLLAMSYGLYYALFDEHQTLSAMGYNLANSFAQAATGDLTAARESIAVFATVSAEYRREIHAHTHWGTLSLLLILMGLFFNRVGFSECKRIAIASVLSVGAVIFPLGVLLQSYPVGIIAKLLSISGTLALIVGFAAVLIGLLRQPEN